MMWIIEVVSEWVSDTGTNEMRVAVDHPAEWTDITGQTDMLPDPNMVVCHGKVSAATYTTLLADVNVLILSAEEVV